MTTKDESLIVKLVKKSVGLPTGKSGCCGPIQPAEQDSRQTKAPEQPSADCGCADTASEEPQPPEE